MSHTLQNHYVYAKKLASTTDSYLDSAMQQLAYSAQLIEQDSNNTSLLKQEATRLKQQTNSFNSIIINIHGRLAASSLDLPQLQDKPFSSPGAIQAIKERRPLISEPYISAIGNLIIFISHPLFSPDGEYLGYIGGSLYLKAPHNILNQLLEQPYYQDGTYMYVVDVNKRILYHPQSERIGSHIEKNSVIDAVIDGREGTATVINSQGVAMLAGYAPVYNAHWGIVAQRPLELTLASLENLIVEVIKRTLPVAIITFLLVSFLAHLIARPLKQLADHANMLDDPASFEKLKVVNAWYFESQQLKYAMSKSVTLLQEQIGQLRHDAQTDPLTGAHNRRSLQVMLNQLVLQQVPFVVLEIDVDFFKRINDTFGHDRGDEALIALTRIIKDISRKGDIVARTGGEEFLLVLPNENCDNGFLIAERLRQTVASTELPVIGYITVSIGIAMWPKHSKNIEQVYKCADQALYHAKASGRNQSVVAKVS